MANMLTQLSRLHIALKMPFSFYIWSFRNCCATHVDVNYGENDLENYIEVINQNCRDGLPSTCSICNVFSWDYNLISTLLFCEFSCWSYPRPNVTVSIYSLDKWFKIILILPILHFLVLFVCFEFPNVCCVVNFAERTNIWWSEWKHTCVGFGCKLVQLWVGKSHSSVLGSTVEEQNAKTHLMCGSIPYI
jgi:hypothetical protein